ncbi:hypothetical protein OV079_12710 [Nannocystis pusilla]|uniref:Uncharacterized protein n=1 Tax=Nannocystis pusilla TaxID=889268 RepID=A0A9X3EMG8_9BACT|nr:hypothetical protein [Nannocystis pusilla]MCY1006406.1 hypothetical protein [Nannocystis pusilla]
MTPPATHAALQSSPATPGTALEQAVGLVAGELSEVDARLEQLLQSSIAIIPELGGKLAFAGGKRFRPLVTLLARARPASSTRCGSRSRPSASCCTRRPCSTTT